MKSSVYQVTGCSGSQKIEEVGFMFDSIKSAREDAERLNQLAADGRGETLKDYLKSKQANQEGIFFADKFGRDGERI